MYQLFLDIHMGNMKYLWFYLFLHAVYAQQPFGTSFLKKSSRMCRQWSCLNTKLGLPDELPPKEQYATVLKSLLPDGAWQDAVEPALATCYGARPRRYAGTCPGQALMHCAIEQLIANCPQENLRKEDACAPVFSVAGFNYLFSQSRYENLEQNMPSERRPSWFLKNYFSSKCCNLPDIFSRETLSECGVGQLIHYYPHTPRPNVTIFGQLRILPRPLFSLNITGGQLQSVGDSVVDPNEIVTNDRSTFDPLDCCEMNHFIQPSWRSECDFHLTWGANRLVIEESRLSTPELTTAAPNQKSENHDVKIVPVACEQENCVFKKLGIVSDEGTVDVDAFSKLLDNMTRVHTSWTSAKARVITKCLSKPVADYEADCDINKILACTFDVLTENCPYAKKSDPCKHTKNFSNDVSCQISSSKFRPKNRRQFCGIPSLVNHQVLLQCGVSSVSRMEYVPEVTRKPAGHSGVSTCKDSTNSTRCLLTKMDVLNRYGFMDYFKMKDRIRHFTDTQSVWAPMRQSYLNVFLGSPLLYKEHCNTPKKLLNILDAMLMTCPISKRKVSTKCNRLFEEMTISPMFGPNATKADADLVLNRLRDIIMSQHHNVIGTGKVSNLWHSKTPYLGRSPRGNTRRLPTRNSIHENVDKLQNLDSPPKVQIMPIKPSVMSTRRLPLVLRPVYLRTSGGKPGFSGDLRRYENPVLRSAPLVTPPAP